jgi:hypothetical protein
VKVVWKHAVFAARISERDASIDIAGCFLQISSGILWQVQSDGTVGSAPTGFKPGQPSIAPQRYFQMINA